jgi:solute carrier family 25 S-adenosylmethionine transporter 26
MGSINNNDGGGNNVPVPVPVSNTSTSPSFTTALIAGGLAGTSVDVALFPIDTLKTRMQSPQGFIKAGGFRGIYNGIGAAAIGSAPGAALFFSSYEVSLFKILPADERTTKDN